MAHCVWNKCDLNSCALYWHKENNEEGERNLLFPDIVAKHSAQSNFLLFPGVFLIMLWSHLKAGLFSSLNLSTLIAYRCYFLIKKSVYTVKRA